MLNGYMLIDCGVSYRSLLSANVVKKLKIVLLTHIHSDHFNRTTIRRLAAERPTLRFACCKWLTADLLACGVQALNIDQLQVGKLYNYGAFMISPIQLYHDVPNCGWRVFYEGDKAIYLTDTVTLEGISAKNYDLYLVEANYSEPEIQSRIQEKESTGQYVYEYRVLKTHLSKEKCDEWLLENLGEQSEYIYIHQHKEE